MIRLNEHEAALLGYNNTGNSTLSIDVEGNGSDPQFIEIIVVDQDGERVPEIEEELSEYLNNR